MSTFKKAVLKVSKSQYSAIINLATVVVAAINDISYFTTPAVPLADISTANAEAITALTAWGDVHNRGSHNDLLVLKDKCNYLLALLRAEANYVTAVAHEPANEVNAESIITSSGFAATADRTPQVAPGAVTNFRSLIRPTIANDSVRLAWKKPLGGAEMRPSGYAVLGSDTADFASSEQVAIVTKGRIEFNPGTKRYFKVYAFNAAGNGVLSNALFATPCNPTVA